MKTVHQGKRKDKGHESQSDVQMVFFRIPVETHRKVRRLVIDIEERTGKPVTIQSLLSQAVTEFIDRNAH